MVAIILFGSWIFLGLVMTAGVLALHEFSGLVRDQKHKYFHFIGGALYLALACGSFVFIRFGYEQGAWLTLAVMIGVWASDIGAYAMGKLIGGPKMSPRLSPNKTWAGLGGAMFFFAVMLVFMYCGGPFFSPFVNTDIGLGSSAAIFVFLAGLFLGLVGQAGDLAVSFYKRRAGAKDTGTLIPGHGGLLDRIDSLLLVSPVFLGILLLCL